MMRERFWKIIACICTRPVIRTLLIRFAMRHPYFHIGNYMQRYWLIPFTWNLPFSIRLHYIMRPDADPYLHDHPWDWRSIILTGYYWEVDVFGESHLRMVGDTFARTAETLHRIDAVSQPGVWTLFIMGRKRNRWGFMIGDPARKTYHRDFVSANSGEQL